MHLTYRKSLFLAVLAGVTWSVMALFLKLIESADIWQILFYRSASMICPLSLLIFFSSSKINPITSIFNAGIPGAVGSLGLSMAFLMTIFAIKNTTAANALFLFSAAPFISAILGYLFLNELIRLRTVLSIIIALLGIYIMVGNDLNSGDLAGQVAAVMAGMGFAIFAVSLRWRRQADKLPIVLSAAILSTFLASVTLILFDKTFVISFTDFFLSFLMGCVIICGGMVLFTKASAQIPSGELTLLTMMEVVLGPLWVYLILAEEPGIATIFGGLVIAVALIFNSVKT